MAGRRGVRARPRGHRPRPRPRLRGGHRPRPGPRLRARVHARAGRRRPACPALPRLAGGPTRTLRTGAHPHAGGERGAARDDRPPLAGCGRARTRQRPHRLGLLCPRCPRRARTSLTRGGGHALAGSAGSRRAGRADGTRPVRPAPRPRPRPLCVRPLRRRVRRRDRCTRHRGGRPSSGRGRGRRRDGGQHLAALPRRVGPHRPRPGARQGRGRAPRRGLRSGRSARPAGR